MPEPLEVRAAPGGGILEILFGMPLVQLFYPWEKSPGSTLDTSKTDEWRFRLPTLADHSSEYLSALATLHDDSDTLSQILADTRDLLTARDAPVDKAAMYEQAARSQIDYVAQALSHPATVDFTSHRFLGSLLWVDELFSSIGSARRLAEASLASELPTESDGASTLGTGFSTLDGYGGGGGGMPPVAANDYYMTLKDVVLAVEAPGVLGNDYDPDSDPLSASLDQGPSSGTLLSWSGDGGFAYQPFPPLGFVGTNTMQYRAYDGTYFSNQATVTLKVKDLRLHSVTFQGSRPIFRDPEQNTPDSQYEEPQWLDEDLDGSADGPNDHKYPVAYVRGETLMVSAEFKFPDHEGWSGKPIWIHAWGPNDITIPWTEAWVSGDTVTLPETAAEIPFPNCVMHYDDFELNWLATVQNWPDPEFLGPGSMAPGTSSNDLYLTLDTPQVSPMYHTVVHLGSHYAQGDVAENDVILDVWNNVFSVNSVARVDDLPLWYYQDWKVPVVEPPTSPTKALLTPSLWSDGTLGDGRCQSWTHFMLDVLKAQGIQRQNDMVTVYPTGTEGGKEGQGFLIKSWEFHGAGSSARAIESIPGRTPEEVRAIVEEYPYLNVLPANGDFVNAAHNAYNFRYADVTDNQGLQGKGPNDNPFANFSDHGFTQFTIGTTTMWMDPSYGRVYWGADEEARLRYFEDGLAPNYGEGMIAGYWGTIQNPPPPQNPTAPFIIERNLGENGRDINGDGQFTVVQTPVMLIKKNTLGTPEIQATVSTY